MERNSTTEHGASQATGGSSPVGNTSSNEIVIRGVGPRHSILDLAPLELECMSALWPMGEGTVRDIHRQLSMGRARAYTTVLTIMDRLAHKGIVARRKVGRAYWYRANLSADEARWKAVEKIVAGFFAGSREALAAYLSGQAGTARLFPTSATPIHSVTPVASPIIDTQAGMDRVSESKELD